MSEIEPIDNNVVIELTADVVSSYVSNNPVPANELPGLISSVFSALSNLGTPVNKPEEKLVPAVPIKKSITDDYIICLEDGKKFKSLKRHLNVQYNLTPEAYRSRWSLPSDYPMVAPAYAAARSELAKTMGLGRAKQASPAKSAPKARKAK